MTQLRLALPLLALASLSACIIPIPVPNGTPGSIVVDPGDSCGARSLQNFVGQPATVAEATTFQGAAAVRVLRPGDVITQEVNPARVNFRADAAGTIVVVDCG